MKWTLILIVVAAIALVAALVMKKGKSS